MRSFSSNYYINDNLSPFKLFPIGVVVTYESKQYYFIIELNPILR